ncbi:MAG TPA: LytTR family DNA-binding domain-containing protein [Flavobacterium sp.]|nr:LytTR family DNA-binding domain-containing protein [Flavobacterium sp.]
MNEIRTVIVDDETASRNILCSLLARHCPAIDIVGTAASAGEGHDLIAEIKPDLVFLDVRMPEKTGFDMLRMFGEITFGIIFVTAYDEYAVMAFEFSAIDYILKPIDYTKLISSVDRAVRNIRRNTPNSYKQFIRAMGEGSGALSSISLHKKDKVVIVEVAEICYIQADRNYCEVVTHDSRKFTSSKTLCDYETLLAPHSNFLRINKSMIINVRFIKEYSKGAVCFITLSNCHFELEVSRRKKAEILQVLKTG